LEKQGYVDRGTSRPGVLPCKRFLLFANEIQKNQGWREINKHAPDLGQRSMVYESNRIDNSVPRLSQNEVVVTTYSELVKSLPQPDPQTVQSWRDSKLDVVAATEKWTKEHIKEAGLLHQIDWYRVSILRPHI